MPVTASRPVKYRRESGTAPPRDRQRTRRAPRSSGAGSPSAKAEGRRPRRVQVDPRAGRRADRNARSAPTSGTIRGPRPSRRAEYSDSREPRSGNLRASRRGRTATSDSSGAVESDARSRTASPWSTSTSHWSPRGRHSGRVIDEDGEPLSDMSVWAVPALYVQGRRQLVPNSGAAQTDDTGQYRVLALRPAIRDSSEHPGTWIIDDEDKPTLAFAPTFFPRQRLTRPPCGAPSESGRVGQRGRPPSISRSRGRCGESQRLRFRTSQGAPAHAASSISITQETIGPNRSSMSSLEVEDGRRRQLHDKDLPPGDYRLEARRRPR